MINIPCRRLFGGLFAMLGLAGCAAPEPTWRAIAANTETTSSLTAPAPKPRRITVSLLGLLTPHDIGLSGEEAVVYMQKFWRNQIELVLPDKPDLIVLPEACDRFFAQPTSERLKYYEYRGNKMRDFFADIARRNHCYIAYSAARRMPDGSYRNATELIGRDGNTVGTYHKNHLVPDETTEGGILCGKEAKVFQTDFGKVAMAICFDLNFDELLQKYAAQRPDLIIFSSMYHGGLMQEYWAYRCRSWFVSAFHAESTVVNPLGETVAKTTEYTRILTASINLDRVVVHLDGNKTKLQRLKAKYGRGVTIHDPGKVGALLVTSELPDVSAETMIREFEIETWDEYYARCLKHRTEHMEP